MASSPRSIGVNQAFRPRERRAGRPRQRQRARGLTPLLWLLLLLLCAAPARAAPLRLVATLPDLGALCREVAADRAAVQVLLQDGEDPLLLVPRPEHALVLGQADLLVALGGPLEAGWLPPLLRAARNGRIADYLEARRVLGAAGEGYPLGDPRAAATVAGALAEQLAALDPAGAAGYRARAAALAAEVGERQRGWLQALQPLRAARVVAYDDSFRAFLAWAGAGEPATLSPAPGVPPSPRRGLLGLRTLRDGSGPRLILQREHDPPHLVRLLRQRAGAPLVVVPLGARAGRGERYLEGLERLVHAVAGALREPRP